MLTTDDLARGGPVQHHTREFKLDEIVRMAASGSLALPEFQREFVWEPNQVVDLLDSVANGWPIGSLLVLEGPQPFGVKPLDSGPIVRKEQVRLYLLDGQQRVTALFHALSDTSDYTYYVDFADLDGEEQSLSFRWATRRRGIPKIRRATSVTVAGLASDERFADHLRGLPSSIGSQARNARKERLGYLVGTSYRIPSTVMNREIDLEAMTRIFETLNRTGVQLNAFDLMVAVLYPVGFNLRKEWDDARDLRPIFKDFDVDGLELLKLIALWFRNSGENRALPTSKRVQGVRQRDILRLPPWFVDERWASAVIAYEKALGFLAGRTGVGDSDGVPSESMLLALAYHLHAGLEPSDASRWWWDAVADQRYLQGANTQILTDLSAEEPLFRDLDQLVTQVEANLQEPVRRNRILRLGLRGLIVTRGGLDPYSGEPLEGPVTDVAVSDLMAGQFKFGSERPTAEIVVFSNKSVREVRRVLLRGDGQLKLNQAALLSQGLELPLAADDEEWRLTRARTLVSWMEPLL